VTVTDREPEDAALKRFDRMTRTAKIQHEVTRRKQFENNQDRIQRKNKEKGLFKCAPGRRPLPALVCSGRHTRCFAGSLRIRCSLGYATLLLH
jgi:ribosomal protein S21